MAEECRLCGATVRVADAAHVMLNAPDAGVRDHYVCPACYEESVDPLFDRGEADAADTDESGDHDEADGGRSPDRGEEEADHDGDVAASE